MDHPQPAKSFVPRAARLQTTRSPISVENRACSALFGTTKKYKVMACHGILANWPDKHSK